MAEKQRLSESDTIILSLHDRWWGKVLAGEKPLEIRKTRPAGKGSYRVLVYVTGTGEIKGEFVCKEFLKPSFCCFPPVDKYKFAVFIVQPVLFAVLFISGNDIFKVCVGSERILHATPVEPVRAEKTAAVLAVLQRGRRAGHYDNQSACQYLRSLLQSQSDIDNPRCPLSQIIQPLCPAFKCFTK